MTLAELRAKAIEHLPCRHCAMVAGARCVGPSGRNVAAHKERVDDIRAWLLRQPEVDKATEDVTAAQTALAREREAHAVTQTDLMHARERISSLTTDWRTAELNLVAASNEAATLTAERDALQARLDALEPEPTTMLIGAGGGNTDRTAQAIDIDRPYYGGSDADLDKFIATAKRNHAAGILTWATFKLPVSWALAAAGGADAWFDRLAAKARALGFEVWIDLHHEPEGDGPAADWRKMNARLALRLGDGKTGPVKFLLCVTGYSEEYGDQAGPGSWAQLWPNEAAAIYAIAYDNPYLRYGKDLKTGVLDTTWSEGEVSYVKKLAARAKSLGVKAAIGEMGYSDEAFAKDPAWLDRTLAACSAEGIVGVVYFDSILNSTRSWALGAAGSPKRTRFETAAAANR